MPRSQQVVLDAGVPKRVGLPVRLDGGAAAEVLARGTRTVLVRPDRSGVLLAGARVATPGRDWSMPVGGQLIGTDDALAAYRDAAGHHLVDTRRGGDAPVVPPFDLDRGSIWTATATAGEVRVGQPGGTLTTVVPADPGCMISGIEARQGDVLVRCASGEGRIHAART